MAGKYDSISQGKIDGHKDGLESDLSLYEFARNFDFEKNISNYWLGFGAGYVEGQTLRFQMKKIDCELSFEEKIECCRFLFSNRRCQVNTQDYLDNIQKWNNYEIDFSICQATLNFLDENKIQRAIDAVFSFYKENFRLKALKVFYVLYNNLKDMRYEQRETKGYDNSKDRAKIESDLKSWLKKYGQKK